MSRSGYSDDDGDNWAHIMWRGRVASSIRGKRGQAMLQDLLAALDSMPDKRLYPNNFATVDGEYCALGVLGAARGIKMDDLGDAEDGCDQVLVAERFGVAAPLVQEIMWMNDEWVSDHTYVEVEICGPMRKGYPDYGSHRKTVCMHDNDSPHKRWRIMRKWVEENIKAKEAT